MVFNEPVPEAVLIRRRLIRPHCRDFAQLPASLSDISITGTNRHEERHGALGLEQQDSVGVESIAGQRTVLFGILNDLHEAMMASAGFPGLAQHRIKHRDLTKQVDGFAGRCERNETTLNLQLLNFLRDWLTNHIQQEDQQYRPWLNAHGKH